MKKIIRDYIEEKVANAPTNIGYRTPLVGFARSDDPLFAKLKIVANRNHLLPADLLPEAKSAAAFFIPFTEDLVKLNRTDAYVSVEWAKAYIETNRLIEDICKGLTTLLGQMGIKTAWQMPTHNFDPVELYSMWSHKHVAYICGLGSYGKHTMLITDQGCAGRFGSFVMDCDIGEPDPPRDLMHNNCAKCSYCIKACPCGALTANGLDKQRCYKYVLEVDDYYGDLPLCDVCGKCANGPCALKGGSKVANY